MRTSAAELQHCHPGRKQSPQWCAEGGSNRRVQHPQERRGRRTMARGLPFVVRSHTRLPNFARLVLGLAAVTPSIARHILPVLARAHRQNQHDLAGQCCSGGVTPTGRPSRAAWPQSPPAMRRLRRVGRPLETPRRRPLTRQTTRARRATARPVTPDSRADPRVGSPAKRPSYPSGKLPQPRRPTRTQPRPTYDAARQTHSPPARSITARSRPRPINAELMRLGSLSPDNVA